MEVIKQRRNILLIHTLKEIRSRNVDDFVESILNSKVISLSDREYPSDTLHTYAKNIPANRRNEKMLSRVNGMFWKGPGL